jgi:hypothetical protein
MCNWVLGWHALVQIIAPGEPFNGGYSLPQNGRDISKLALRADAPELSASGPFIMSASLVSPHPVAHHVREYKRCNEAANRDSLLTAPHA